MADVLLVLLAFFVVLFVIVLPPGGDEIPQYYDESGEVLSGSVAEKKFLEVDDGDRKSVV